MFSQSMHDNAGDSKTPASRQADPLNRMSLDRLRLAAESQGYHAILYIKQPVSVAGVLRERRLVEKHGYVSLTSEQSGLNKSLKQRNDYALHLDVSKTPHVLSMSTEMSPYLNALLSRNCASFWFLTPKRIRIIFCCYWISASSRSSSKMLTFDK
jgi:hypothetical protein